MYRLRLSGIMLVVILALCLAESVEAQMRPIDMECGNASQGKLAPGEEHVYRLRLYVGDVLKLELVANVPVIGWALNRSNNNRIDSTSSTSKYVTSGNIPIEKDDDYLIVINSSMGSGTYTLYITCTFADGTVKEPDSTTPSNVSVSSGSETSFSGFGFPGVAAVDFNEGIEIPLQSGQVQTVPVGNDVTLYSYEVGSESKAILKVERVSGDISIGVTVIKRDTNEIVFLGGLPSSDKLSVELSFPSNGIYVIGLFRLDTTERTNTSGGVQISIE